MAPLALAAGMVLVVLAPPGGGKTTSAIYAFTGVLLFTISAIYHLGNWSPTVKRVLKRLDHTNIMLLIAGSYTPLAWALLPAAQGNDPADCHLDRGAGRGRVPGLLHRCPALALHPGLCLAGPCRVAVHRRFLRRQPGRGDPDLRRRRLLHRGSRVLRAEAAKHSASAGSDSTNFSTHSPLPGSPATSSPSPWRCWAPLSLLGPPGPLAQTRHEQRGK